jgi:G3E family GTPase
MGVQSPIGHQVGVWLVTGFLGSGKTTVLNACLQGKESGRGTALIINEVAGLEIDPMLLDHADEGTVLFNNGCVCCTVRDELIEALLRLDSSRQSGRCPSIERVVIETSGLADPNPVIHELLADPRLRARYYLAAVLTLVDATHAFEQMEEYEEAARQIALADYLLTSKTDLCIPVSLELLDARLKIINPTAVRLLSQRGKITTASSQESIDLFSLRHTEEQWRLLDRDHVTHDIEISSHIIEIEQPLPWGPFSTWLQTLCLARGRDLLRFKGIVFTREQVPPVAVHAVHFTIYPPDTVSKPLPFTDRITRLVFIARRLDTNVLRRTLAAAIRQSC